MVFPTLAGIISEPISILSAAEEDTFTAQQFVDGAVGGMVYGAVLKTLRDDSVVKSTLGQQAYERVKSNRILGFL